MDNFKLKILLDSLKPLGVNNIFRTDQELRLSNSVNCFLTFVFNINELTFSFSCLLFVSDSEGLISFEESIDSARKKIINYQDSINKLLFEDFPTSYNSNSNKAKLTKLMFEQIINVSETGCEKYSFAHGNRKEIYEAIERRLSPLLRNNLSNLDCFLSLFKNKQESFIFDFYESLSNNDFSNCAGLKVFVS